MVKHTLPSGKSTGDLDAAVRQIVSKAVASEQVVDIFAASEASLAPPRRTKIRGAPKRRSRKNLIATYAGASFIPMKS
jgi:hypothetical protein